MNRRSNGDVCRTKAMRKAKARRAARSAFSCALAFVVVFSCNGWSEPLAQAWAQGQKEAATQSASSVSSEGASAEQAQGTDATGGSSASAASSDAGAAAAASSEGTSATDATAASPERADAAGASSSDDASAAFPAQDAHENLAGSLFVKLSYTLDGADAQAPASVTLQLQKRTQAWDAASQSWGAYSDADTDDGWKDVTAEDGIAAYRVTLSAQEIADAVAASTADTDPANDGAAFAFADLPVQTVDQTGAYVSRTAYRAVLAGIDAKEDATSGNAALQDVDAATQTARYAVAAAGTASGTASYTASLSVEAGLAAVGSTAASEQAATQVRTLAVAGTSVPAATDATSSSSSSETTGETNSAASDAATADEASAAESEEPAAAADAAASLPARALFVAAGPLAATLAGSNPAVTANEDGTTTYTYTVHNDTKNYASDGAISFALGNLPAKASVAVTDAAGSSVAVTSGAFSVKASAAADVTIAITTQDVDLTQELAAPTIAFVVDASDAANATNRCENYGTTVQTLANGMTFYSQQAASGVQLKKVWRDNGTDSASKATSDMALALQSRTGNDGTWTTLDTAVPEQPASLNEFTWTYYYAKQLYTYIYVTATDGTASWQPVAYRLAEPTVPAAYASSYDGDGTTLVNTLKQPVTYTVKWLDASNAFKSRPSTSDVLDQLKVTKSVTGGTSSDVAFSTTDSAAEGYVQVTENADNTWTVTLPNALAYNEQNNRIHYALTTKDSPAEGASADRGADLAVASTDASTQNASGETTFAPAGNSVYASTYKNAGDYASRESAVYDDGTLSLSLSNTATFSFTKNWKDDGSHTRPSVQFTLYRYLEGQDYTSAAPVPLIASQTPATEDGAVTLCTASDKLPYFDESGNRYVYFAKETLASGGIPASVLGQDSYVPVRVASDGTELATEDDWTSSGLPNYDITNGGIMENRLTGTTDIGVTKTWKAAARQDVKAAINFDLYRNGEKVDDGSVSMSGFRAETPTVSTSYNVMKHGANANAQAGTMLPKYDSAGQPISYELKESAVQTDDDNDGTYEDAVTYQSDGQTYFLTSGGYLYKQDATESDGNATFTNTLVGTASIHLNKQMPQGLKDGEDSATFTFTLSRNGEKVGTRTITVYPDNLQNGTVVSTAEHPIDLDIDSYDELDDHGDATGSLPRYDENGTEYVYDLSETDAGGYSNTHQASTSETTKKNEAASTAAGADKTERVLVVTDTETNTWETGDPSITVYKQWNDAQERLYRDTVHFAVYYAPKLAADGDTAQWVKLSSDGTIATNEQFVYAGIKADDLNTATGTDDYRTPISGDRETGKIYTDDLVNDWRSAGRPGAPTTDHAAFKVVETAVGNHAVVSGATVDAATYPEHATGDFVAAGEQNYDVTYETAPQSDGASYDLGIVNTRVGVEYVDLSVNWNDGKNANSTRPSKVKVTVTATDPDAPFTSKTYELTQADGADASSTEWHLRTEALKKYNSSGAIITYTVSDVSYDDGDDATKAQAYTKHSMVHANYAVGAAHTGDVDSYVYTNTLYDTVQPYANKYWKDLGDEDSSVVAARPDIKPTLYRSWTDDKATTDDAKDTTVQTTVDGATAYTHVHKMDFTEHDWNTKKVTVDWWQCSFVDVDRYTADGYQYTYYIAEDWVSASHGSYVQTGAYDKQPSTVESDGTSSTAFTEDGTTTSITYGGQSVPVSEYHYADAAAGTDAWAGTIVNRMEGTRTVSGEKTWNNIPSELDQTNYLIDVTFGLTRVTHDDYEAYKNDAAELAKHADIVYSATEKDDAGNPARVTATINSKTRTFQFGEQVDAYDKNGEPYEYFVEELSPASGLAFQFSTDATNGLQAVNTFNSDQNLTVSFEKTWNFGLFAGQIADNLRPTSTLTLVRYLTDASGAKIAGTREAAFAQAGTGDGQNTNANKVSLAWDGSSDKQTVEWTDLAYLAPNGNPYHYEVEEANSGAIVAYQAKAADGLSNVALSGDTDSYNAIADVTTAPTYSDGTISAGNGSAAMTNAYGSKTGAITVTKAWKDDENYALQTRPDQIAFQLERSYTDNSGATVTEHVSLAGATVAAGSITGTTTSDAHSYGKVAESDADTQFTLSADSNWSTTIDGLQQYAPNGSAYSYSVKEVSAQKAGEAYDLSSAYSTSYPGGVFADGSTYTVTNTLNVVSAGFTKTWQKDLGGTTSALSTTEALQLAKAGAMPTSIAVRYLCAYQKADGTWSDWAPLTQDASGTVTPVERSLTFNEKTGAYVGATTIDNLPRTTLVDNELRTMRYVAYEYALTYADGTQVTANAVPSAANDYTSDVLAYRFAPSGAAADAGIGGSLTRSEASADGTVTSYNAAAVNTIPIKQLTVRKTWDDDGNRDGYRPASLDFSITRDGTAVTDGLTLASGDALPSDAYTASDGAISYTSGNGPDWQAAGHNQAITATDVWQGSLIVPVWKNDATAASSYTVAESLAMATADNYVKTFQYNNAGDATAYTVASATAANDLGTAGTRAFFVNVHAPWDTFAIAPSKTWFYNGHQLGGTDSPALLAAYAQKLADSGYKLALQLQYKLDGVSGKSDWQAIDAVDASGATNSDFDVLDLSTGTDGKITASSTGTALASVATANTIAADGTVTFDFWLNKKDGSGQEARSGVTGWAGLPLYWHTGDASAEKIPYQYRVVEGYVDGKGTFTAIDNADAGALTNFASDHGTDHTAADVAAGSTTGAVKDGTATVTAANTLKTTGITVAKTWTDTNNAYLSRPDSVTFHLEYTTASDDSAWENVPQGWAAGTGSDAAGTATVTLAKGADGSFASQTVNNLPTRDASGAAYRYRAVEDSYTYGTGTAAKTYTVGTSADSTTDGVQNPYYADATAVAQASSDGTVTFANKLVTTSFAVTKTWAGDDAWNLHNDIDHVTVKLQHRSSASGAWTDVPSGTYDLTAGENWSHTWDDLPKIDGTTGNAWEYRAVEVSYTLASGKGGSTVSASYASADDPTSGTVGAFAYGSQTTAATGDAPATTAITNTLITGTVHASKKWDDDNNRDNVRPAKAMLTLAASGTQGLTLPTMSDNEITVTTTGTAEALAAEEPTSWSGLPVFDASGAKISYAVGEQAVSDYTASAPAAVQLASGTDGSYAATADALVNSRTPQTTSVAVSKTWNDNNDYGDRSASVAYTLHATVDGTELSASDLKVDGLSDLSRTVTVASDGAASTTWESLPVYQPGKVGKKITYTVTETKPTGYETPVVSADTGSDAGHTFAATNTMPYTSLTVSKSWTDDFGVNAGIATVTFALQRSSDSGATWTDLPNKTYDLQKAADGTWPSVTLDNLPAKNTQTGADYVYRAVETDYTLADGTTVAAAPQAATVDGKLAGTVGAYTFVSKVDTDAKTTELANMLVLGELNVTKAFSDANNQDDKRPDSIGLTLTNDKSIDLGDKATKTIAIANATGWSQSWADGDKLPVRAADGSTVTYTVTETGYNAKATDGNQYAGSYAVGAGATQQGYSARVTLDAKTAAQVAFTNTETSDTVDVTATKKWSDNNAFGDRPAKVSFTLHAKYDGAAAELTSDQIKETLKADTSKTLSATDATKDDASAWAATWSGLPKNMPGQVGKQLTYWVTEDTTPTGYAQASDSVQTTVTNTMDKKTTLTVKSSWANEIYGVGAKSATFKLQRMVEGGAWTDVSTTDAVNHPVTATIEKSQENATSDSYTFTDLPMYSAAGEAYSYRAVQTALTSKADAADTPAKPVSDSDATNGTIGGYTYASSTSGNATDGFTTSNTNTMTRGKVTVTKAYKDAENQDGTRPESATFTLSADQTLTGADKVLAAQTIETADRVQESSDGWTYTWDDLPTQMADGTTINYTVTEGDVSGYAASYSINGGTASSGNAATTSVTSAGVTIAFTNAHDSATTSVTATKKWDDGGNAYGDRPGSVTYTLHAKAGETELSASQLGLGDAYSLERSANVSSDAAGAASATWDNLPVYQPGKQGQKIAYSVTESQPAGYQEPSVGADTGDDAGGHAFEVTNALDPLTYTVEKVWANEPGFLTVKADAATFKLQRTTDGENWSDVGAAGTKTVARGTAGSATAQWTGLPKCDQNGNAYSYRAVETSIDVGGQTVNVKPDNGDPTAGTVGGYTYSSEVNKDDQAKTTVTNAFRTAKLSVSQKWDDDRNRDGKRQAAKVTVSASENLNGMPKAFTLEIGKDAGLDEAVADLPVTDAAGKAIAYTVTEDAVDDYSTVYALGNDKGATPVSTTLEKGDAAVSIVNSHTPETKTVTATKLWSDQDNAYGDRPDKVEFALYAQPDGGDKYPVAKDESGKAVANPAGVTGDDKQNTWTAEWSDLPVYQPGEVGKKITYTVEEAAVAGYEKDENGLTVTNTQDTTSLTATKEWGADPANIGRDVAGVTIALQRSTDGSAWSELATQEVKKASDSQQASWTGLPTHDKDGNAYAYRAVEKTLNLSDGSKLAPTGAESGTVGGYDYAAGTTYAAGADEQARPGTGSYATKITNAPSSGSLSVAKAWDDDGNRDGIRPGSLGVTLSASAGGSAYALGTVPTAQTLAADGWAYTWDDLPVADAAGNKLEYTVTEGGAPQGYAKTKASDAGTLTAGQTTALSIVNTHTPGTVSVTADKTWADDGNASATRPAQVTYTLQFKHGDADWADASSIDAGYRQTVDVAKDAAGAASFTWNDLPAYYKGSVGDQIHYRVVEEAVNGYSVAYSAQDVSGTPYESNVNKAITVTNTLQTTGLSVAKTWNDGFGISKAVSATDYKVQRSLDGVAWSDYQRGGAAVTGSIARDATMTSWQGLPAFDLATGTAWKYRAVETGLTAGSAQAGASNAAAGDAKAASGTVGGFSYETGAPSFDSAKNAWSNEVTNSVVTGSASVAKAWDDDKNRDGARPDSVGVTLSAGVNGTQLALEGVTADQSLKGESAAESWTTDNMWAFLPVADAVGNAIAYTVTEGDVPQGYEKTQASDAHELTAGQATMFSLSNKHVPGTTTVTATKQWDDNGNLFGDRPETATLTLHASYEGDGGTVELAPDQISGTLGAATSKTLSSADEKQDDPNAWTATWENLPEFMPSQVGKKLSYWVSEDAVPAGYKASSSDDGLTIVNALDPLTYTVEKVWANEPGFLTVKADAATFKLQRTTDGKRWSDVDKAGEKTVTRTQDAGDAAAWSGLPSYDQNGTAYAYRAVETSIDVNGQTVNVKPDDGNSTAGTVGGYAYSSAVNAGGEAKTTVTNSFRTAKLSVSQSWDDDRNRDGKRQEAKVTVSASENLNGMPKTFTLATDADAGLVEDVADLPVTDAAGKAITYTVTEENVDDYSTSYALGGVTAGAKPVSTTLEGGDATVAIVNAHTPVTTQVTATKKWEDASNMFGDRPGSVQFLLHASYTDEGGATRELTQSQIAGILKADTVRTLSGDSDAWQTTWSGLPAYFHGQVGKRLTYWVTESQPAAGYTATSSDDRLTVTNALDGLSYTVEVGWTGEPQDYLPHLGDRATFKLQRTTDGANWSDVDKAGEKTVTRTQDAGDAATWSDLPQYDQHGRAYSYRAVETSIDVNGQEVDVSADAGDPTAGTVGGYAYRSTVNEGGAAKTVVANSFQTGSLHVTKTWSDDNDRDGARTATTVTVTPSTPLNNFPMELDVSADSKTNAGLDHVIAGLPVTDAAGNAITYGVSEAPVAGYTTSYEATGGDPSKIALTAGETAAATVTNSHTPATTTVTATKVWDDQDNAYGDRPDKVEFTLYAQPDGGEKYKVAEDESGKAVANPASVTGDANENTWTAEWSNLPVYQPGQVGKKIAYTVEEAAVAGYEKGESGLKVTNTQDTTSLTATKEWGADPANIGRDVAGVTIALQRSTDGAAWSELATQEVKKASDSQQVSWTGLPTHDKDGNAYSYRAVEKSLNLADGESLAPTGAESGTVGGYDYAASTTYAAAADEQARPGTGTYATKITNAPSSGSLSVAKAWNDDNNRDDLRAPVTATLSAKAGNADYGLGDVDLDRTLTADGWSGTWDNLPVKNAAGDAITYTVTEGDAPEGYAKTQPSDAGTLTAGKTTALTLKNAHTPDTVDVTATKQWDDNGNLFGDRPETATLTLHASYEGDGGAVELAPEQISGTLGAATSKTLSAADKKQDDPDAWTATWENLPEFMPDQVGKKLAYWVSEDAVPAGYEASTSPDGLTVTNRLVPTAHTVEVGWTGEPKDYLPHLGDAATFKLQRTTNGGKTWSDVTMAGEREVARTQDAGDTAQWDGLPTCDKTGNAYAYRAVETSIGVNGAVVGAVPVSSDAVGTVGGYAFDSSNNEADQSKTVVTNAFRTARLHVSQKWVDDGNRDGKRQAKMVKVSADAGLAGLPAFTLSTEGDAGLGTSIGGLPVTDAAGTPIAYTVTEEGVDEYSTAYALGGATAGAKPVSTTLEGGDASISIENVYRPGTTQVTATKQWDDNGNLFGDRPETATLTLHASYEGDDGKVELAPGQIAKDLGAVTSKELTAADAKPDDANAWTATWENLPAFMPGQVGKKLAYWVSEDKVPAGYTASSSDDGLAIVNALDPLTYTVEKVWANEPGFLEVTGDAATFKLQRTTDGASWSDVGAAGTKTVERGTAASATAQWTGLPKCDKGGNAYSYRAVETSIDVDGQTVNVKPDDGDPTAGTVGGYAYGSTVNENGEEKTTVTNSFRTAKLSVSQSWDDDRNRDGKRQAAKVTVSASADLAGMPKTFTLEIGKDAGLDEAVADLPVTDAAGKAIAYTVAEENVDDYSTSYALGNDKGATPVSTTLEKGDAAVSIVNSHTPETKTVTATKLWSDQDNAYGDRPDKVEFALYAQPEGGDKYPVAKDESGKAVANPAGVTGDAKQNEWTAEWKNLPVYQPGEVGKKITYTVEEAAVAGYEKDENGLTVTNTQDTTSLTATKEWGADPANIGRDVAGVTIALQRSAAGASWSDVATQDVAKSGASQQVSWTGLPTHDKDGNAYAYRAVEKSLNLNGGSKLAPTGAESGTVGGYDYAAGTTYAAGADEQARPGTGSYAATITNTPAAGSLSVAKAWNDDGNRDGIRPGSLGVTLSASAGGSAYALGTVPTAQTLAADGWAYTWDDLPVADATGNKISYTVTEGAAPEGYDKAPGSDTHEIVAGETTAFSLKNAHTPGAIDVTATKQWDDQGNNTGFRPVQVTYTLQAKHGDADWADADATLLPAGVAATQTVDVAPDAAGAASFTWEGLPAFYPGAVGEAVAYRVLEAPVDGYASTCDTAAVTGAATDAHAEKTIGFTNALDPMTYTFGKTDATGAPLAGATLTLTGRFAQPDGTVVDDTRTVLSGQQLAGLAGNSLIKGERYTISEQEAPAGYTCAEDATITVAGDGTLTVDAPDGRVTASTDGHAITVADEPTAATFAKQGADGQALAGATYRVEAADGSSFADGSTEQEISLTDDSSALRGLLVVGDSYRVTETAAPAGHYLNGETLAFTVNRDGTLAFADPAALASYAGDGTASIVQTDAPINLRIQKANAGDGTFDLSGATFALAPATAEAGQAALATEPTDASGATDLANLPLAANADYTVTETTAPAGFACDPNPVTIHVASDGAVSLAGEAPGAYALAQADDGTWVLTCADEPFSLQLQKTDSAGQPLAGAVFEIAGSFADGSAAQRVTVDDEGVANVGALLVPGQTYTLTETQAPAGFETLARPATFTMDDAGAIALTDDVEGQVKLDADGRTLVVADQPTPAAPAAEEPAAAEEQPPTPDGAAPEADTLARTGDDVPLLPLAALASSAVVALFARRSLRRREAGDDRL